MYSLTIAFLWEHGIGIEGHWLPVREERSNLVQVFPDPGKLLRDVSGWAPGVYRRGSGSVSQSYSSPAGQPPDWTAEVNVADLSYMCAGFKSFADWRLLQGNVEYSFTLWTSAADQFGICDFPVVRRARVAPVLVLWCAGISPAGARDLHQEFSSLAPVSVQHRSWRTALMRASR